MKKSHGKNEDHSQKLLDYRKRRGRPRKDSDNPFEQKVSSGKADSEPVKPTNVKVLVSFPFVYIVLFVLFY